MINTSCLAWAPGEMKGAGSSSKVSGGESDKVFRSFRSSLNIDTQHN
jgi:hypothetical protein